MSALVNQAWRTFQQPDETVKYVLQLAGVLDEEEKYQLPPDFLMEVMELNEMKMDGAAPEAIRQKALQLQADIESKVAEWLQAPTADLQNTEAMQAVKQWYYQKKYIDRILAE
jgi:molecular chaperone HscB